MSVYTHIRRDQLKVFLSNYTVGEITHLEGISDGIENTNYFVTTNVGEYVLTLFEVVASDQLPFFLDLMANLSERGLPCAHPVANQQGDYVGELNNKPAALVQRLLGSSVEHPTLDHCRMIGVCLAQVHRFGLSFTGYRENEKGPHWWRPVSRWVIPHLGREQQDILSSEIEFQAQHQHEKLPRGIIHADLFRDNALFQDGQLTGVIDFYNACNDALIYDLAITINDWCKDSDGRIIAEPFKALVDAYESDRAITDDERRLWPVIMRAAALRFWLSRLKDKYFPRPGLLTMTKDPDEYLCVLRHHRDRCPPLP